MACLPCNSLRSFLEVKSIRLNLGLNVTPTPRCYHSIEKLGVGEGLNFSGDVSALCARKTKVCWLNSAIGPWLGTSEHLWLDKSRALEVDLTSTNDTERDSASVWCLLSYKHTVYQGGVNIFISAVSFQFSKELRSSWRAGSDGTFEWFRLTEVKHWPFQRLQTQNHWYRVSMLTLSSLSWTPLRVQSDGRQYLSLSIYWT